MRYVLLLALLLLPACRQPQYFPMPTESFSSQLKLEWEDHRAMQRTVNMMVGKQLSSTCSPEKLIAGSALILGESVNGYIPRDILLEAEEFYDDMDREERVALASEVILRHLTGGPLINLHSEIWGKTMALRSYDQLHLEDIQEKLGGVFVCEYGSRLLKRMVARIMLEDIACAPEQDIDSRCAAIQSLRHLFREAAAKADGEHPMMYAIDALPNHDELEEALFGGQAWGKPTPKTPAKQHQGSTYDKRRPVRAS